MTVSYSAVLQNLVGLKVTMATHAASMRGFVFGSSAETPNAKPWVIHIQCPWRVEAGDVIVTGSGDWYQPADLSTETDDWDPANGSSLQDARLRQLFQDKELSAQPIRNQTMLLVCTGFEVDAYGGVGISLSGGYVLRLFPAVSRGEHWRIFQKGDVSTHVICEA